MRHKRSNRRLKQKPGHARMLRRNLLTSVLLYEKVRTTKKRAAVVAPEVDKLIAYAKSHAPHIAIRYVNQRVTDKNASKKIMEVFTKRFAKKSSGLTRTKALGFREGDGAELVELSLVEGEAVTETLEAKEEEKATKAKATKEKSAPKKKAPAKKAPPKKKS